MRYLRTVATLVGLILVSLEFSLLVAGLMLGALIFFELILYRPDALREGTFLLALLALVAGIMITGDAAADLEFYVVTAQVVPALFVALAVEIHGFMKEHAGEDRRAAVIVGLSLAFAEYESLTAVACQDPGAATLRLVVGALAAAGVGLVLPVSLGPKPVATAAPDAPHPPKLRWIDLVACGLILIASRRKQN
jgi:hypothetical protein